MPIKPLITLTAIVTGIIGLIFLFIPAQFMSLAGVNLNAGAVYIARLLGLTFISIAILSWYIKNSQDKSLLRSFSTAALVQSILGFIVCLQGTLGGSVNALGWLDVILYGFFTAGYAIYLLTSRD